MLRSCHNSRPLTTQLGHSSSLVLHRLMQKQRIPFVITIAIVAALTGVWLAQLMRSTENSAPALTTGTVLPSARALPAFELINTHSQAQTQALFKDHWSVLFFGYTSCPDVCPTTLTQLAQVKAALAAVPQNQQPQFVFISVDPKRDTPAQLNGYLKYFDPSFIGLTGTQPQIDSLTHALGVPVFYQQLENGSYTVDHAATLFMVDPQARLYALFTPPYEVRALAEDLRRIVTH